MGGWRDKVSSRTCYCGVYLIDLEPRAVLSLEMISAAGSAVTLLSVRLANSEYYIMSFESGTGKLTDAKGESACGWGSRGTMMKFFHLDFPRPSVGPPLETG